MNFGLHEMVEVDQAHCDLVYGLLVAAKPASFLQLGFGNGRIGDTFLKARAFNQAPCSYTVVDYWLDWDGAIPGPVLEFFKGKNVELVTEEEATYVRQSAARGRRFDFIVADAGQEKAHEWFEEAYGRLLAEGGILVFHDVDGVHPGLAGIPRLCREKGIPHRVFNRSTRPDERCRRGLLVIFK